VSEIERKLLERALMRGLLMSKEFKTPPTSLSLIHPPLQASSKAALPVGFFLLFRSMELPFHTQFVVAEALSLEQSTLHLQSRMQFDR
jgi:hypothetical protein